MFSPACARLVRPVSRSFYLSLRVLPDAVREPLAWSYLLARATDTIADVDVRPADERLELLDLFRRALTDPDRSELYCRAAEFAVLADHAGERVLLSRLEEVFRAVEELPEEVRRCIREVLEPIIHGQELDLRRFPDAMVLRCLPEAAALQEYTWLVAGCVGEFWTTICDLRMPRVFRRPLSEMKVWAARYGQGLQLVNILRDQAGDAAIGRCYLPEQELRAAGLTGEVRFSASGDPPWQSVQRHWIRQSREWLSDGRPYVESTRSIRLRLAAVLPLLIGEATLRLLETPAEPGPPRPVKVGRAEMKRIFRRAVLAAVRGRLPS